MRARLAFAGVCLFAVLGPFLAPRGPTDPVDMPYAPPSRTAWLGTDYLGADVLSRVLLGGRWLVLTAVVVLLAGYLIGIPAGLLAGYRGGWVDAVVMRLADVLMAMPAFVLLAVVVTGTGRGAVGAAIAITLVFLPDTARIVRAATVAALVHDYVEVAVARGERARTILVREVLPNLTPTLAADAGVRFLFAVTGLAVASFLGLGAQPPAADWGLMVFENQGGLALQPFAVLAPGVMLLVLLLSASLFAESVVRPAQSRGDDPRGRPPITFPEPAATAVAEAVGLSVHATGTGATVLNRADLTVHRGQMTALVGESGCGKTTLALALLGHVRAGLAVTAGGARLHGEDLFALADRPLRRLRRTAAAYVPQDPRTALPAHLRIVDQIGEVLRACGLARHARRARAAELLARVNLPSDAEFLARRPHQLSGGQLQRVAVAVALAHSPSLLVLDEPTSALDPENAARLLADVAALCRADGTAVLLVSHDLSALAEIADTVAVLRTGRIVETGPAARLLAGPAVGPGTRAAPRPRGGPSRPVLAVRDLTVARPGTGRVLDGVDFAVPAGGCLCVVGPSGAGKTTLLRAIAGLVRPERGRVTLSEVDLGPVVRHRRPDELRRIQLVPQNPYDSLNPRHTVGRIVGRPAVQFRLAPRLSTVVAELLAQVDLDPQHAHRRPAALSGGERQRVALARALAARPDVLLCDEVTSSLDATVAAAVLDLLDRLRWDLGLTLVVVTHDRDVVRRLDGEVLELGPRAACSGLSRQAVPAARGWPA